MIRLFIGLRKILGCKFREDDVIPLLVRSPMSSPLGRCYDLEGAAAALPADAHKVKVVGYSLAAVASLPRRLANPSPRQSKLEYARREWCKDTANA